MHFSLLITALATVTAVSSLTVRSPHPPIPHPPPHPPHPPPPHHGYYPTFTNLHGATEAGDYLTFYLVPTIADCFNKCNHVKGCGFVNTYHDVHGKDESPLLTCSLYKHCHGPSDAINRGGQTQPDGNIDYIINSDGWCKY